jgi:GDPmannose 4,6-dehydratase
LKKAILSGITGQDGSYLTEFLLDKGYEIHGLVRRSSQTLRNRLDHLRNSSLGDRLHLHYSDLSDTPTLRRIFKKVQPDEFYHLAGQSHVGLSFEMPESTVKEVANATISLLEICRDLSKPVRIYHAASSEIFGKVSSEKQDENTPMFPTNPYGCAKAFARQMCQVYRESYGMFVCNGILYNHESPRRGENFVTRKITLAAASIALGIADSLELGNIDISKDWGHAKDYVVAMWKMLQTENADDYVIATGKLHSLQNVLEVAFNEFDLKYEDYLKINQKFYRPAESFKLCGNPKKAEVHLEWKRSYSFKEMITEMCRSDFKNLKNQL